MNKRTALVTGGSRGIGLSIAQTLSGYGYNVILPTRQEMNLLSNDSIDKYLSGLSDRIDIVVNNAGINPIAEIQNIDDSDFDDTLQVNLVAPFRIIKNLVPAMIENHFGRIVNISSIWSIVSRSGRAVYSASKSGLNGMTRTMAIELAQYNVLINNVAPGYVNTELTAKNNTPEEIKMIEKNIPIHRLAEPQEISEAVQFLISDKNTYITGQTLVIDGGYTCQ